MNQANYNKVRWHCRRGMLELDMLLHGYFDAKYAALSEHQQKAFVDLLTWSDQDLWRCIFADEPVSNKLQEGIIKDMVLHHKGMLDS
jgi:antitoxin CptB